MFTNDQSIDDSIQTLQKSFDEGKTKSLDFRMEQLLMLKTFLTDEENAIVEALAMDLHRPPLEAVGIEVLSLVAEIDYVLKNLELWSAPQFTSIPLTMFPATSEITYEPLGTCLIIGPFNYPVLLTVSMQ